MYLYDLMEGEWNISLLRGLSSPDWGTSICFGGLVDLISSLLMGITVFSRGVTAIFVLVKSA